MSYWSDCRHLQGCLFVACPVLLCLALPPKPPSMVLSEWPFKSPKSYERCKTGFTSASPVSFPHCRFPNSSYSILDKFVFVPLCASSLLLPSSPSQLRQSRRRAAAEVAPTFRPEGRFRRHSLHDAPSPQPARPSGPPGRAPDDRRPAPRALPPRPPAQNNWQDWPTE